MRSVKRSATEAQLPTSINHPAKRPMYAQTFPSRRTAYGGFEEDAPEGHSLLNRWIALVGDTVRALWERSADVASRIVPPTPEIIPEARIPLPESPSPLSRTNLPSRPPIPDFFQNTPAFNHDSPTPSRTSFSSSLPFPPTASTSRNTLNSSTSDPLITSIPNGIVEQPRQSYPKHKHIHMDQHKQKVKEHNRVQMERLRNRRTSLSEEMDMEKALIAAKRYLATEQGTELVKQWEIEKATGDYRSDLDSFAGLQTYRQMVLQESNGSLPTSPSLPELSRSLSEEAKPRQRRSSFNLQRALQIARQSLNDQQPILPAKFEQLQISLKDRDIEKRIREANRLPKALPPNVAQEIKLLRTKRGVVSKFARGQVSDTDLARLDPHGRLHWLNDEIINFYGALILDRSERHASNKENMTNGVGKKRKGKAPEYLKVHYFSTFFWPKIEKGYKESRLNKWTKKLDIFQKDVVLIPVNHGNVHWSLAAINFKKKRVESYDSMAVYRGEVYKLLRKYLAEEHMDKKKRPFDFTGWIDHFDENTPQQENGYDCGVFTCQFMESLSRGVDEFVFDQSDMVYIRDRMTYEIGRGKLWDESDG